MVHIKYSVFLVLSVFTVFSTGLNILALFPHPGNSHFRVFEPLFRALADKGHSITVISPFPQKEPIPRYRDISLKEETDIIFNKFNISSFHSSSLWAPLKIAQIAKDLCANLRSKPMQEFMKSDEKFDLIITEIFNNDCYLGFVHKYKIPFIGLCPNTIMPWSNSFFGNPVNPAYIPVMFHAFSDRMSFFQRVQNTVTYVVSEILYKLFIEIPGYEEAKLHFGEDLPPLGDIHRNISLLLVNSHFSLNLPRPFVPNVVEVGGMFIEKPKKLPQNIEKFISESEHGVIYFSMGSMIKGHTFPEAKRKEFIKVFSKLKQRILWKWETDYMPDQPSNVMIQKWMPQSDILCHPNVIAFISHGGLLSTTETAHCGKPAIIIPQYGDQFSNAKAMEANNAGVILYMADVTEETITNALNKVLHPSFRRSAESLSKVFRDRPTSAIDTAIYWIEYVARHNGAHHLKTAAVDMPLYQYFLLDVITFITASIVVSLSVVYCLSKFVFCLLFKKKVTSKTTSKKVKKN